jgi:hypothetical protein
MASGTSILWASDKNDVSDDVLDQLGSVMQTVRREDRKKASAATNVNSGTGSKPSSGGNVKPNTKK